MFRKLVEFQIHQTLLYLVGRGRPISSGSSSKSRSTNRVRKGRVTRKQHKSKRKRKGGQLAKEQKSCVKHSGSSSGRKSASTSNIVREATWSRWKDYIDSSFSSTSQCTSPYSDYSVTTSSGRVGILKPRNSGPTCEMPVRFRLPNSSRIVYPAKTYGDIADESDSDSSTYDY